MAGSPAAPAVAADQWDPGPCLRWGVLAQSEWGGDPTVLDRVEALVGHAPELYGFYQGWAKGERFDVARAEAVANRGIVPVVAWEPYDWLRGVDQPEFALARIADGDHDAYIRQWARDVRAWGKPLLLRFAYEMNGYWMPWSEGVNGNQPGEYVTAWRHVHDLFAEEGATNVSWVWAPNVANPNTTPLEGLYPGDRYVDWVGLSGYNWGVGVSHWDAWLSFDEVFGPTLDELRSLTAKPIMIAETASTELGGDKAAWIGNMFASLSRHPDIRAFLWFDYDKETDWRIESSAAATAAFTEGLEAARPDLTSPGSGCSSDGEQDGDGQRGARSTVAACPPGTVPPDRFTDTRGSVHQAAADCLAWWGVTSGTAHGTFAPGEAVTRGQLATFLVALADRTGALELPPATPQGFGDVVGSAHAQAANRLAAAGIVRGITPERFDPRAPVRREQMASFLAGFADAVDPDLLPTAPAVFQDVDDSVHATAIGRVAAGGLAAGRDSTTYAPRAPVSRGQMAAFLTRLAAALVEEGHAEPPR